MLQKSGLYKKITRRKLGLSVESIHDGIWHVHLLHDNAPAHKSSTVAQLLKSEKVNVLPHPFYSPDCPLPRPHPCDFTFFPKLQETNQKRKKKLPGRTYRSRRAFGSAVHQFLMNVPTVHQYKNNCSKNWIKILKRCVLAKEEYFKGNNNKKKKKK